VTVSDLRQALQQGDFDSIERHEAPADDEAPSALEAAGIPLPSELTDADMALAASEDSDHGRLQATIVAPQPLPPSEIQEQDLQPHQKTVQIPIATAVPEPDPNADTRPSAGKKGHPPVPWLLVAASVASVVLLIVVSLIGVVVRAPEPEPVAEPVVIPPTPTPVPVPTPVAEIEPLVHPLLVEAESHVIEGDLAGAQAALEALSEEEIANFDLSENELYDELMAAVESTDRSTALKDLRGGLAAGSIKMLRRGAAGLSDMSAEEVSAEPGLRQDLDHARSALRTHERLWRAKRNGDHGTVLENAKTMISLLPDYSGSYSLRDGAATELEALAEGAIARRDLDAALVHLETIHRHFPERDGLVERMEWCRLEQATDRRLGDTLERALAAGRNGKPEEGLRILASDRPNANFSGRFAEARQQLEGQIADLDANPPEILLPPDFQGAFKKNESAVVPITVTDDYRVQRVAVFVRRKDDSSYREIELQPVSQGLYRFEATPDLHRNAKLFFYVVAADRSGHETTLGSAAQPLELERKRWYRR
jgi:hypothetical protein